MQRFSLQKVNKMEAKEQHHVKLSNRLWKLDMGINRVSERIRILVHKFQPRRVWVITNLSSI
jgi:hypothetical protein